MPTRSNSFMAYRRCSFSVYLCFFHSGILRRTSSRRCGAEKCVMISAVFETGWLLMKSRTAIWTWMFSAARAGIFCWRGFTKNATVCSFPLLSLTGDAISPKDAISFSASSRWARRRFACAAAKACSAAITDAEGISDCLITVVLVLLYPITYCRPSLFNFLTGFV